MRVPQPARHHEDVARAPGERRLRSIRIGDDGAALAFDHREHRAVGRAVRACDESLGQKLHERAHRRHRPAAVDRIGVAQLESVTGVPLGRAPHRLQRLAGARVGVIEHRRGQRLALVADRQQARAVARERIALRSRQRMGVVGIALGERGIEQAHDRNIEPVHPHHRPVALVAVVVPGPRRRDDEVARLHDRPLAIDGRVGARTLDHEAQRRLAVPVRRRHFAWQDELKPGIERIGDARLALEPRVLQHQHAALGLLGGDQLPRLQNEGAHLVVVPHRRLRRRAGLLDDQAAQHLPQGREVMRADPVVIGGAFRGRLRLHIHRPFLPPRMLWSGSGKSSLTPRARRAWEASGPASPPRLARGGYNPRAFPRCGEA